MPTTSPTKVLIIPRCRTSERDAQQEDAEARTRLDTPAKLCNSEKVRQGQTLGGFCVRRSRQALPGGGQCQRCCPQPPAPGSAAKYNETGLERLQSCSGVSCLTLGGTGTVQLSAVYETMPLGMNSGAFVRAWAGAFVNGCSHLLPWLLTLSSPMPGSNSCSASTIGAASSGCGETRPHLKTRTEHQTTNTTENTSTGGNRKSTVRSCSPSTHLGRTGSGPAYKSL